MGYNGRRVQGGVEMKLKSISLLLLLATLMVVLVACGGGISEADIEATVVARLNEEAVAEATVEAKAQAMGKAMVEATAPLVGTVAPSPPARTTIEPSGGVIAIDRAGDPLDGLTIQVPPASSPPPSSPASSRSYVRRTATPTGELSTCSRTSVTRSTRSTSNSMKSSNGKTTTRSTTTARPEPPANNPQKDLLWPPIQS